MGINKCQRWFMQNTMTWLVPGTHEMAAGQGPLYPWLWSHPHRLQSCWLLMGDPPWAPPIPGVFPYRWRSNLNSVNILHSLSQASWIINQWSSSKHHWSSLARPSFLHDIITLKLYESQTPSCFQFFGLDHFLLETGKMAAWEPRTIITKLWS